MSCTGKPIRRRSHQTHERVAGPGVPGPDAARRPGAGGRAPGRHGRPRTSAEQGTQVGGVERPVAVHHRDVLARWPPRRPACTAAPYPGRGSRDHPGPEAAGDVGGVVAWSRCRRRSPRSPSGTAAAADRAGPAPRRGTGAPGRRRRRVHVGHARESAQAAAALGADYGPARRLGRDDRPRPPAPTGPVRSRPRRRAAGGLGVAVGADRCWRWLVPAADRAGTCTCDSFPPLHADVGPARRAGARCPPWSLGGAGVSARGPALAERLAVAAAAARRRTSRGLAWMLALALRRRLARASREILGDPYEYLRTARRTTDLHATAATSYVGRIPLRGGAAQLADARRRPPARGAAVLRGAGPARARQRRSRPGWSSPLLGRDHRRSAVLVTAARARRRGRAPAGPRRSWCSARPRSGSAVSADAMFAAVGRLGHRRLAAGATRRSVRRWAAAGGGLLLGLLRDAVLRPAAARRCWRSPCCVAGAVVAPAARAVAGRAGRWCWRSRPSGFRLLGGLPGAARPLLGRASAARPARVVLDVGRPGRARVLRRPAARRRGRRSSSAAGGARPAPASVLLLVAAAALAIVLPPTLSRMSKAEVERIWLPFVPWLLLSTARCCPTAGAAGPARPGRRRAARAAPARHRSGERPRQRHGSGSVANARPGPLLGPRSRAP